MNRVYRLVYSVVQASWVVVSELTSARGKKSSSRTSKNRAPDVTNRQGAKKLISLIALVLGTGSPIVVLASPEVSPTELPMKGKVTLGEATIHAGESPNQLIIQANTDKTAINWQTHNIGEQAKVHYQLPSETSAVLNRVLDAHPSQILGSLSSNGHVFLLNPNGVVFGPNAEVHVGAIISSTGKISDDDFMRGNLHVTDLGQGQIINKGEIHAKQYVALIGAKVENQGTIKVDKGGSVALVGQEVVHTGRIYGDELLTRLTGITGDSVTLNFGNGSLLGLTVGTGDLAASVTKSGLIQTPGGQVYMTLESAEGFAKGTINHTGITEARTTREGKKGEIRLIAGMEGGVIRGNGTLDVSALNGGDGGFIETSAGQMPIVNSAHVAGQADWGQDGTWLIKSSDLNIVEEKKGTAARRNVDQTGTTIVSRKLVEHLNRINIELKKVGSVNSEGDMHINVPVSWGKNTLTLNAHRHININKDLEGSGQAQLKLKYGQGQEGPGGGQYLLSDKAKITLPAGQTFTTQQGSQGSLFKWTVNTNEASTWTVSNNPGASTYKLLEGEKAPQNVSLEINTTYAGKTFSGNSSDFGDFSKIIDSSKTYTEHTEGSSSLQAGSKINAGSYDLQRLTINEGSTSSNLITVKATIDQAEVTREVKADGKIYDATLHATVHGEQLKGVFEGDEVTPGPLTAKFGDKNVGVDKVVSVEGHTVLFPSPACGRGVGERVRKIRKVRNGYV